MKTKLFLIAFLLGMVVNAQTNIIPFENDIKATANSSDGHYGVIASNEYNTSNGIVSIMDYTTNSVVRTFTITPGGTGTNWGINMYQSATISNLGVAYVMYSYKTRSDNVVMFKVDKLNVNGTITNIFNIGDAVPHAMKIINNNLFLMLAEGDYGFDPVSSGLPNFTGYLFVSYDTSTNSINYAQNWSDTFYEIVKTVDGNLFTKRNNHYWKINPNNGNILVDYTAPSNIDEITYDPFKDKLLLPIIPQK